MIQNTKTGEDQTGQEPEQKNTITSELLQTFALERESNKEYGKISPEQMIDAEPIEGTPFTIVTINTDNGTKSFTSLGNKRISDLKHGTVELLEKIYDKDWELITALVTVVTERVVEAIRLEDKARNENEIKNISQIELEL